jgi:hypothetical protein
MSVLRMLSEGGVFVYLVIVSGLVGIVVDFIQFVLIRKVSLWPMVAGAAVGTLLLGLMGGLTGIINGLSMLDMAVPEQRAALVARGVSMAHSVLVVSVLLAGIQAFFGTVAVTIRANVKRMRP